MPMMLANVVGSQLAGWAALRKPYRDLMLVSAILLLTGTVLMGSISGQTSQGVLRVYMVVVGLGIGISFPVLSMSSTHDMPFQLRATTTSAVTFYRTMGMTLGIAVFGAIQKNSLLREMQDLSLSSLNNNYNVQVLLKPEFRSQLPVNILGDLTAALSHSILAIFHWALIPVALAIIAIMLMGKAGLRSIIQGRENMEVIGNVNETGYSGITDGGGKAPL